MVGKQEKVWDEIASKWNKFRVRTSPSVEKFLGSKKGKILDLGCGSGRNFVKMNDVEFYGVDFSGEMLRFAEKRAKALGIEVILKKSKTNEIPFGDNFFDAVVCHATLHCIKSSKERKETLKEIYRTLKPNCEAFISSWGPKSPRLRNKEKECYVPWTVKEETKIERYTYVFDLDELVGLCEEVGFEIVSDWEERNVNVIVRRSS
ncbi:MAG: class I SAM-dependent methyltransferase [Nanoarchaeota archaeon]|nr:class I SAM-dependent methyltransferase [Nanoarchaeota archaeon]